MKKRIVGQTQSWSVVVTIGLAFFNLGLFGIILLSGNELSRIIRENFEIQVFMQKDFDPTQQQAFLETLSAKPFIAQNPGRQSIRFESKEEAGRKFMQETGEDFVQFLGENPLRDAFHIKINEQYLDASRLKSLKSEIETMPGVFEVVYVEELVGTIQDNIARISIFCIAISGLLLITLIWLIRNTIRLSIYAQRFLIRSMELVGAEPWFVQKPYVWSMVRHGMAGGTMAIFLLLIAMHYATRYLPQLQSVLIPEQIGLLLIGLWISGSLLSGICGWLSVRRFLGRRLDDLHIY